MPRVVDKMDFFVGKQWVLLASLCCIADQISKWFIIQSIPYHGIYSIVPGVQLTLSYNRGIAFSFFNNPSPWGTLLLTSAIALVIILIGRWLISTPSQQRWEGIALSFILGGAVGNLIDRVYYGHVIDFIDLYYGQCHWYTFNLADAFISVGAVMLLKTIMIEDKACQTEKP